MKELTKMSNYHNDLIEWLSHEEHKARAANLLKLADHYAEVRAVMEKQWAADKAAGTI